jgi:hypothetical protein
MLAFDLQRQFWWRLRNLPLRRNIHLHAIAHLTLRTDLFAPKLIANPESAAFFASIQNRRPKGSVARPPLIRTTDASQPLDSKFRSTEHGSQQLVQWKTEKTL